jgi:hypothetical protein
VGVLEKRSERTLGGTAADTHLVGESDSTKNLEHEQQ